MFFSIDQMEMVLYSQIRMNYIFIFIITRIAFIDVSRETLSYRSYNSQIHIIVGDTFKYTMDIRRIIPHMAIKLRRIVMFQFSAVT